MKRKVYKRKPSTAEPHGKWRFPRDGQKWIRANWVWVFWLVLLGCTGFVFGQIGSSVMNIPLTGLGASLQDRPETGSVKDFQDVQWSALMPKDWAPSNAFREKSLLALRDSDPRAGRALTKLQKAWAAAPVNQQWNGQRIRIAGYVVPLERVRNRTTEFLLVPYSGACIHVPPPPANQIIRVSAETSIQPIGLMDAVWVVGVLSTTRSEEDGHRDSKAGLGVAGYEMTGATVTPYRKSWWSAVFKAHP